jgi:signal transduction histidine kinase
MGDVMASWDWSATAVGPPERWPAPLRQVVRILLTSRFSMWMAWGPELTTFYNDAYQHDTLRAKHPWALGRPAREVWAEIWDDIGPRIQSVLDTGEATWDESLLLFLERAGYAEETYHTFSYSPLQDEDGRNAGMLCVVTEDTERVLGERRLRILSELGDISAVTAPTVDEACTAALRVLERGRRDVPFASIYLLEDDDRSARLAGFYGLVDDSRIVPALLDRETTRHAPLWPLLQTGQPQVRRELGRDYAGLFVPLDAPMPDADPDSVVAVPLIVGGGQTVGVLFAGVSPFRALDEEYERFIDLVGGGVSTAIADARGLQDQLHRAEELAQLDRAKTEFFTGVSHELRTPLTLIAGPAEDSLTDTGDPLSPGQRGRVEVIARNAGRLRRLVDTLLEFSRLEAGKLVPAPAPVDLASLTRGIVESFAPAVRRAGLNFRSDCPPLPSAVLVDVDMWEKIVLNLLSNAVKYTLAGAVDLRLHANADGVELTVADTGEGIEGEDLRRLFVAFQQLDGSLSRRYEGAGLGLALARELLDLQGGRIWVESALGAGSRFFFTVPQRGA